MAARIHRLGARELANRLGLDQRGDQDELADIIVGSMEGPDGRRGVNEAATRQSGYHASVDVADTVRRRAAITRTSRVGRGRAPARLRHRDHRHPGALGR